MKILYVTFMACGLQDLLEGKSESMGLPMLILPLKHLLQTGHQVDIILASNSSFEYNIQVDWLKKENIIYNFYMGEITGNTFKNKIINKVKIAVNLYRKIIEFHKSNHYNFIYCFGKPSIIGNLAANRMKVPCGYRLGGTFDLYNKIKKYGKIRSALRNPVYFLIFKLKKDFMLITDDGTNGNFVYEAWKPVNNPYPLYFWKSGVDIPCVSELEDKRDVPRHDYLFHAGRIDPTKRQDRNIQLLHLFHEKGIKLHLYLAGHLESHSYYQSYYEKLTHMVDTYGLREYVHFLGAVSRNHMIKLAYHAKAVILFDDLGYRSNVFYEVFSSGSLVITLDMYSSDDFMTNAKDGYFVQNEEAAVCLYEELQSNPDKEKEIRENAIFTAKEKLTSWQTRVQKEIDLIQRSIHAIH